MPEMTTTKAPVGPPIWVLETAECGDEKAGDDGAVNAGLGCESGGDGKGHGQRQSHQAHGDAGNQIAEKLVGVVVAQAKDRLRQPTLFQESMLHCSIMRQAPFGRNIIAPARTP